MRDELSVRPKIWGKNRADPARMSVGTVAGATCDTFDAPFGYTAAEYRNL